MLLIAIFYGVKDKIDSVAIKEEGQPVRSINVSPKQLHKLMKERIDSGERLAVAYTHFHKALANTVHCDERLDPRKVASLMQENMLTFSPAVWCYDFVSAANQYS